MENKATTDQMLHFIKLKDEVTAALLADEFVMTKEGARQHLLKMESKGLVSSFSKSKGVGRPVTFYTLAEGGLARFPDAHAQITVELLKSVKNLLGENALDLLVSNREQETYDRYHKALNDYTSLEDRLDRLTQIRSEEGYMAEWKKEDGEYFLIENHCPICAAATECQGFCRAELKNFRQLIGEDYNIERVKHIISDGTRCVYRIIPV